MQISRIFAVVGALLIGTVTVHCYAQSTCAAFARDGALAKGTISDGKLKIELSPDGKGAEIPVVPIDDHRFFLRCEQAFSDDGKWLATVLAGDSLKVIVVKRSDGSVYRQFSSPWNRANDWPVEANRESAILGGFSSDDSILIWRHSYERTTVGLRNNLSLQVWNIDGSRLSEREFGGFERYRGVVLSHLQPQTLADLTLPKSATQTVELPDEKGFLTVLGRERLAQKAAILSVNGAVQRETTLPYFPNLLGPLVPDWFYVGQEIISPDGKFAAIPRSLVAWVLVDTDRDWGSEILLLDLENLSVVRTVKTGQGGISAVALNHVPGKIHLVGFWNHKWHKLEYDDANTRK